MKRRSTVRFNLKVRLVAKVDGRRPCATELSLVAPTTSAIRSCQMRFYKQSPVHHGTPLQLADVFDGRGLDVYSASCCR